MICFYPALCESSFLVPQRLLVKHCWLAQLPEALQHSFLQLQPYVQTPCAVTSENLLVSPLPVVWCYMGSRDWGLTLFCLLGHLEARRGGSSNPHVKSWGGRGSCPFVGEQELEKCRKLLAKDRKNREAYMSWRKLSSTAGNVKPWLKEEFRDLSSVKPFQAIHITAWDTQECCGPSPMVGHSPPRLLTQRSTAQ